MYSGGGYEIVKVLMRHYLWDINLPISLLANQNAFCPWQFFGFQKNPSTSVLGTEFVFCPALFPKNSPLLPY